MFGPFLNKSVGEYLPHRRPLAVLLLEHALQQSVEIFILCKLVHVILVQICAHAAHEALLCVDELLDLFIGVPVVGGQRPEERGAHDLLALDCLASEPQRQRQLRRAAGGDLQ